MRLVEPKTYKMKTVSLCITLLFAAALAPLPASAQDAPGADLRTRASEHMKKGKQYQDIGDHRKAVDEFKAAYDLLPHALILYNIGNAYRLAGDKGEAITYFEKFVALEAAGGPVEKAKKYLAALKPAWEAEKAANVQKVAKDKAAAEAAARAKAAAEAAAAQQAPPAPTPPKTAGATGQHFFIGLGIGANSCFDIGNKLCQRDDAFSHAPSYAITISPGYRFHPNAGATLDIGIGSLTPTADGDYDGDDGDWSALSTMTIGATFKGFVPVDPVELVAGLGFGTMSHGGDGPFGDYTWSGTAVKLEAGVIYGSMGGRPGLGIGGLLSYHLALSGDLTGDGADALERGGKKNAWESGSPYFDLLQFSLAVSYAF